jgi:RND family efflux transporter MFP subunit
VSEEPGAREGDDAPAPLKARTGLVVMLAFAAAAVILAIIGIVPRVRARTTLQTQTDALAAPDVLVAKPKIGKLLREIVLPGNVQAYTDSPVYARTSGYLKTWAFDIGAHVKKGQRLAVIESPEVDQQLAQAKADLETVKANAHYADTQSTRYRDLLDQKAVSTQDADNFRAQASSTSNQVQSATSNVRRLQLLTDFENVVAPFDGIITARSVDIGTLIDAGAVRELFHLVSQDVLRVYVNVPQVYSASAVPGVTATLTLAEMPGRTFPGTVVRTARAIDPTSRTLLVEIDVDNHEQQLLPGAYAQVHLKLSNAQQALIIPVPTLIFRSEGLRVAVVQGDKARLVPITIARDDGKTVEVASGLRDSDRVIQNPPDSLIDGEKVNVVQREHGTGAPDGGR